MTDLPMVDLLSIEEQVANSLGIVTMVPEVGTNFFVATTTVEFDWQNVALGLEDYTNFDIFKILSIWRLSLIILCIGISTITKKRKWIGRHTLS